MTERGKYVGFLDDQQWLNDLAFLVDITKHLADLNFKLQGKDQLVRKMYACVVAFVQKLKHFRKHLHQKKLLHFTTLATRSPATPLLLANLLMNSKRGFRIFNNMRIT